MHVSFIVSLRRWNLKVTVEIPVNYEPVVQKLIADGRFRDEGELVAEGLRLVLMQEMLREDLQAGLDELNTGNRIAAGEVYAEALRSIKAIEDHAAR
jgi:Arc/MetJ-type ribon-helix-helix transcriptional regulator